MTQVSLWQQSSHSVNFAELCNALYERELCLLAQANVPSIQTIQAKLKSLPYYIQRVARVMSFTRSYLTLDSQNASWSAKQSLHMPLVSQEQALVNRWYQSFDLPLGLVIPIALDNRIVLDSIDRVDNKTQRFRTNAHGWFSFGSGEEDVKRETIETMNKGKLLKANKKVMLAACCGHCWQGTGDKHQKCIPIIPNLRELLLSCSINWKNFKKVTPNIT